MTRAALMCAAGMLASSFSHAAPSIDQWSQGEIALLASMRLSQLPAPPPDPSNAFENNPSAIELGKQLFFDNRFSRDQSISCASCHDPEKQFQDGRPRAIGVNNGITARRTMPLANAAHGAWFFWDGRKDSLWSQALGPMEDAREFGGNRVRFVHVLGRHYRGQFENLFGALPDAARLPAEAGPLGNTGEIAAWNALDADTQRAVSRVFANIGKAIAAYEKTIRHTETRFDRYAGALAKDKRATGHDTSLTPAEIRGLRIFIGKGKCVSCHNGPLFTDHFFHSTRVPPNNAAKPDPGREQGALTVQHDPFNCLGPFSDAKPADCRELRFIVIHDPALRRAFKTPGLRGVALRAPYMHAGQFESLDRVVRHYVQAPESVVTPTKASRGHGNGSELNPLALDEDEINDLIAFLGTLSSAVLDGAAVPLKKAVR